MKPFITTMHTQARMLITRQNTRMGLTKSTRTPTKGTRSRFFTEANKTHSERKIQPTTRTKVLEQLESIKASVSEFPAFVPTLNKYLSKKLTHLQLVELRNSYQNGNKYHLIQILCQTLQE